MQAIGIRKGFTLIELLVVIAIIAILAAILFPVFAQVREKARQISCTSNEKQMGLGILQYVEDYDERFPMAQYYDAGGNPIDWPEAIYPYVKNGQGAVYASGATEHNGQGGIFACPSFPVNQPENYGISECISAVGSGATTPTASDAQVDSPSTEVAIVEKGAASTADGSGGPNFEVFQGDWAQWMNCTGPAAPAGAGGNPTCTENDIATLPENHADLAYDFDEAAGAPAHTSYPWPGVMPRYRHQLHTNVLFIDGHVKSIAKGQLSWGQNIYIPGLYTTMTVTPTNLTGDYSY